MKTMMRKWLCGAAIGVMGLCLALGSTDLAAAQDASRVVVSQSSDTLTLDPSVDTSPISLNLFKNIYDQLTDIKADGSVAPLLASSWESSKDAKVWTFTITPNVKFHDGSALTIEDVVWSFTKIMADKKSPVAAYLSGVEKVEADGADKVKFTLKEPFAPFDRQVSLISILPQKIYEERGASFAQNPVGTGPYKVVKWVKDDRIELEAFADYHGGKAKYQQVIFRPVPSESARTSAFQPRGHQGREGAEQPGRLPGLRRQRSAARQRQAAPGDGFRDRPRRADQAIAARTGRTGRPDRCAGHVRL